MSTLFVFLLQFLHFSRAVPLPGCQDGVGANGISDCPRFPERCTDPMWSSLMRSECPLTCKLCTTQSRPSIVRPAAPNPFVSNAMTPAEESRSLDVIYQAALAEGGRLILYAGGDTAGQQDFTKRAFEQRFPGMTLDVVVDYSKFHGPRIDLQLAQRRLVPDAVQLQTVQDFPRWKAQGVLLQYKPAGWSAIYPEYRDEQSYYNGLTIGVFSNMVNSQLLPDKASWPLLATDYLKPEFQGRKIVSTYPNDDDAVLWWYKQVIDKYGWSWLERFARQDPIWVRGTAAPSEMLGNDTAMVTMSSFAALDTKDTDKLQPNIPAQEPMTVWAQQAAIFRQAAHPEAAKLYFNWILAREQQQNSVWSVRTDVTPLKGYPPIWQFSVSKHRDFVAFMSDRRAVEILKAQISLYIGEPQGEPSPGLPGLFPDKALPH